MHLVAYHITWGTYGTRLHGDPRRTVDRKHNRYGEPVLHFDEHRWEREKSLLKFKPVVFTKAQMQAIELWVPSICERGGWAYRTCAVGEDHVHVILTSPNDPKAIRRILKRWLGQSLSEHCGSLPEGATWWAEGGSIRWIFEEDEEYFENAMDYVRRQRATACD